MSDIPDSPFASHLPGALTKLINRNRKKFESYSESNKQTLICGHCGRKGQYDRGRILFDPEQQGRDAEKSITADPMEEQPNFSIGKTVLHDGTSFQWVTDAEEHLLDLLADPDPKQDCCWIKFVKTRRRPTTIGSI